MGRVAWCAAPCPGDKHKAVNSWSVSGHRHPENESSKNCREELSLFPSDVQSGNFLWIFQNDSGAFETRASKEMREDGSQQTHLTVLPVTLRTELWRTWISSSQHDGRCIIDSCFLSLDRLVYFCHFVSMLIELRYYVICFQKKRISKLI